MKVLISEKLSAHKVKTPEGYLICSDAILARTGKQTYTRNELFQDGDNSEIEVDRTPEEVFSEETLASFENKPLTITHPDEDVTPDNHRELGVGFVRDVRRATRDGQEVMIANIVVTDAEAIEAIESGELLELSCGYDCDISDDEHPCQRNIRGNHVALCKQGRAGNARIVDSKSIKDTDLKVGMTFVARSGARLVVKGISSGFSDYNGEAYVKIKYYYVSASGKKSGTSEASTYDFWKMLTDESLTGDSIDDEKCTESQLRSAKLGTKVTHQGKTFIKTDDPDLPWHNVDDRNHKMSAYALAQMNGGCTLADAELELPEEEDSEFRYYDAYGQEIHVVSWDGRNQFMVIHKGKEMMMNRRDAEYYLDRQGARFSKVIRDTVNDSYYTESDKKDKQFVKEALSEMRRYVNNWSFMSAKEKRNIGSLSELKARIKELEQVQDSVKDAIFEICYINNVDIRIMMQAKSEEDARRKFWNQYGAYYIKSIKKIRDSDTQEEVTKGMKKNLKNFKDAKYRVGQTVIYRGEKSKIVKIEHDDKYGYDLLIVNPFYKNDGKSDDMIWVGENVKTIDCEDCDTNDALRAIPRSTLVAFEGKLTSFGTKIEATGYTYSGRRHYQLSLDKSGHSVAGFIRELERLDDWLDSIGIPMTFSVGETEDKITAAVDLDKQHVDDSVKDGMKIVVEVTKSASNKSATILKNDAGKFFVAVDGKIFELNASDFSTAQKIAKSMIDDSIKDASNNARQKVQGILNKNPQFNGKLNSKEFDTGELMIDFADWRNADKFVMECKRAGLRCREGYFGPNTTILVRDSKTKDAMQNFEITWLDTYKKAKGYSKDEWRFVAEIKANNLTEALQKLADKVALGGVGTANTFVVSIHSDKTSYQYSGKLSELLRKNFGDSKKEFIVKVNGKKYKTQAYDSVEAVQNIEKVLTIIKK